MHAACQSERPAGAIKPRIKGVMPTLNANVDTGPGNRK
jgi:hypothetical protein